MGPQLVKSFAAACAFARDACAMSLVIICIVWWSCSMSCVTLVRWSNRGKSLAHLCTLVPLIMQAMVS